MADLNPRPLPCQDADPAPRITRKRFLRRKRNLAAREVTHTSSLIFLPTLLGLGYKRRFVRDDLSLIDIDAELAKSASYYFYLCVRLIPQLGCHTGSHRMFDWSNRAVMDHKWITTFFIALVTFSQARQPRRATALSRWWDPEPGQLERDEEDRPSNKSQP